MSIANYGTGLLPDREDFEPPCARLGDAFDVMSVREIVQELKQPGRVTARKVFGPGWIKSQGTTNGCNGWAAAGAEERARIRAGHQPVKLAGAGIWTQLNRGRNVGTHLHDAIAVMQSVGCPPEHLFGQASLLSVQKSSIPRVAWEAANEYRVLEGEFYWATSEEELGTGLVNGFTAVVAITANGRRGTPYWQLDNEGIIRSGNGSGNHAIGVDDVAVRNDGGLKFDHFGSWGRGYGDQGRAFVRWDRHLSGPVRYHRFYLIRATSQTTDVADNPPIIDEGSKHA